MEGNRKRNDEEERKGHRVKGEIETMGVEGLTCLMEQAAGDKIETCRLSFVKGSGSF